MPFQMKKFSILSPNFALVCVQGSWNTGKWPKMLVKFTNMYYLVSFNLLLWNKKIRKNGV